MNITNVLHRSRPGGIDVALETRPAAEPPRVYSLEHGPSGGARWPGGAVVLVALLAIAAVLCAVGVAAVLSSDDDGTAERELRGLVATLTTQRAEALEDIATLDAEIASLRQQLTGAQEGADGLAGQVGVLESRIASLTEERAAAQSSAAALEAELTSAQQELATAQQELVAAQQRLTDMTADRDALARLFPVDVAPSLDATDTVGTYEVTANRIYCVGLSNCGSTPSMSDLTIRTTPEGYLRADIPGLVEGGLFRADGAFHLVAESNFAVPSCAGVARTAGVTMTIFPGSQQITRDGTHTVTALNAVITVEAPAVGSCPAVLTFNSAELTPRV